LTPEQGGEASAGYYGYSAFIPSIAKGLAIDRTEAAAAHAL